MKQRFVVTIDAEDKITAYSTKCGKHHIVKNV